jgi:hypothetical protein
VLPTFDDRGNLPAGVHVATWDEVASRFGTTPHRRRLLDGLKAAVDHLRTAGCRRVYLDGSFVTDKAVPGDFDAAWEPEGVDLDRLEQIEPVFFDFTDRRAAQKEKYLGEFFPSSARADPIGNTFLEFFQIDKRSGEAKGIIALDL